MANVHALHRRGDAENNTERVSIQFWTRENPFKIFLQVHNIKLFQIDDMCNDLYKNGYKDNFKVPMLSKNYYSLILPVIISYLINKKSDILKKLKILVSMILKYQILE